jgi:hypothetical protein
VSARRVVLQGETRAESSAARHAPQLLLGVGVLAPASDVRAQTGLGAEADAAVGALKALARRSMHVAVLAKRLHRFETLVALGALEEAGVVLKVTTRCVPPFAGFAWEAVRPLDVLQPRGSALEATKAFGTVKLTPGNERRKILVRFRGWLRFDLLVCGFGFGERIRFGNNFTVLRLDDDCCFLITSVFFFLCRWVGSLHVRAQSPFTGMRRLTQAAVDAYGSIDLPIFSRPEIRQLTLD